MVKIKPKYDFGGIFGHGSKNYDKIPTANLISCECIYAPIPICLKKSWLLKYMKSQPQNNISIKN